MQQVAFVVTVDQNAQFPEWLEVFLDFTHPVENVVVIILGHVQELDPAFLQGGHCGHNVVCSDGDVLHACALVEVDVFLDLALFPASCGLVDGEFDPSIAIAHHLGHEGGVLRADVFVVERHKLCKPHHLRVEFAPCVHFSPPHIAHHVVNELEPHGGRLEVGCPGPVARQKHPVVSVALHEDVHGVAVGFDGAQHHLTVRIASDFGGEFGLGAALGRFLKALARVRDPEGHRLDAVPVFVEVGIQFASFLKWRGEHQGDLVLSKHIADPVFGPGFQPAEGERLKAPSGHVVIGALFGIAYDELHVVCPKERQEVVGFWNDFVKFWKGISGHGSGGSCWRFTASFGGSLPTPGRGLVG